MRLPLLPPSSLSSEQKELYNDIMGVVKESFESFTAAREDGALSGPFNPMLHFPAFGRAIRAMHKTIYEHTTLPKSALIGVILNGYDVSVPVANADEGEPDSSSGKTFSR